MTHFDIVPISCKKYQNEIVICDDIFNDIVKILILISICSDIVAISNDIKTI
jgi:hypothetical protein